MKSIITILLGLFICLPLMAADKDKEEFEKTKSKAEKGDRVAQCNLGWFYYKGEGVERDFKEAFKWYQKAAEQGVAKAQSNLGLMYEKGRGVEQDFKEAMKWYRKAAEQGDTKTQFNLGAMYYKGQGVEQDNVAAYAWLNIAASNGLQNAQKGKSVVAKEMTAEQITEAEALVKEMVKKNPKLIKKP